MSSKTPSKNNQHYLEEIDRLKELFEKSRIHFHCLNSVGEITEVNSSWLRTLGYKEKEVVGTYFGDFLSKDSELSFRKRYFLKSRSNEKKEMELTLICKDGSQLFTEFSCISSFNDHQDLSHTYCIFKNITRLRNAEQALRESEQKFSSLVELANVGIYEFDPYNEEFTYANDNIKKALNIRKTDTVRNVLEQYLSDEDKVKFKNRLAQIVNGDQVPSVMEYKLQKGDGESIWVQVSNSFIVTETNKTRVIGVVQNITDRKKLEIELKSYYNRLEQITLNLPSVIIQYTSCKSKTEFLYLSQNIIDMTGYSEEEIMHNPDIMVSLINKEDHNKMKSALEESISPNIPETFTYRICKKDGATRWINTIISHKPLGPDKRLFTGISNDITEEVLLKNKLESTEKKYESLVNSAAPGISTMSKSGIIKTVNPRLCEISGYAEEELVGKHFMRIPSFYTKDISRYIKLYKNALKGEISPEPIPFEWKHKNGEKRWGEGSLSALKDQGRTIGYQGVFTETTHRVLLEKREKQRKKELDFLFKSAISLLAIDTESDLFDFLSDQVHILLPKGIIIINSISKDFSKLTIESFRLPKKVNHQRVLTALENKVVGRTFEADEDAFRYTLAGRLESHHDSLYDLTMKQLPEEICIQVEKLINLGQIYEISLGTKDHILGGAAILLPKGIELHSASAIELLFKEASAALIRIRSARQLDLSEKEYRSLSESTEDWIIRFDTECRHIYVNNAVATALKKNKEEIYHSQCQDVYQPEYAKLIEDHINQTVKENKVTQCEIKLDLAGRSDFFEWRFFPESIETGNKVGSVLVNARNISQRKEEEGKLLENVARKNKLYSILSHDLISPFTSQLGFLNLLMTNYDTLSDDKRKEYVSIIENSSQNIFSLLKSVLEWTKEESSSESRKPTFFDLRSIANKAVELNNSQIVKREMKVHVNIPSDIIVHADYNMIFTAIRNILSNALKFSNAGGEIYVSAYDQGEFIICKTQDFGTGIKKEDLNSILNKDEKIFYKGQSGEIGSGLGLKFSRELLKSNKGEIWIESEYGKGTTVYFTVPK